MSKDNFADDLQAVSRINAVRMILEVVCRTAGMGDDFERDLAAG